MDGPAGLRESERRGHSTRVKSEATRGARSFVLGPFLTHQAALFFLSLHAQCFRTQNMQSTYVAHERVELQSFGFAFFAVVAVVIMYMSAMAASINGVGSQPTTAALMAMGVRSMCGVARVGAAIAAAIAVEVSSVSWR